ncbi:hypothetical protein QTP86_029403 [Hemibagrus guttatus]|nr:hypothetical protein QTP86_029403 [Hemibagrus guttatus]
MPSPSDSSSAASLSGSRAFSGSRRGTSGRARASARVLLYLGLCHLALGAMVLAFSFTSLAFSASARVRQSCPFWAGFFVVASGIVGVISWRRPFTLVVSLFMLLSAVCVILSLAGSMLSCQNAQMVKSYLTCRVEHGLCVCCDPKQTCSLIEDETLVLYLHADCHSVRHQLKDLLFSACGLSILSTIICTLSTVTCSIHIFSLDLLHLLAPHRTRSVNPECTTPQDAFLTNMMDFEEFVPPIPPPPYYPPEYTCSSETDAQSITYNGSMESPVPLYPTDCPPPYEAVIGQRDPTLPTHPGEASAERGTSVGFSGEVSGDSGSLLMSEIVDIPDDSSPSEDSCVLEVAFAVRTRARGVSEGGEGVDYSIPQTPTARCCFRGERSNSCSSPSTYNTSTFRSPVMRHQALLAYSCSHLEMLGGAASTRSSVPEILVCPCTSSRRGSSSDATNPRALPSLGVTRDHQCSLAPGLHPVSCVHRRCGRDSRDSEALLPLVRSHSEPGLSSSTDTGDFPGSVASKGISEGGSRTSSDTGRSSACLLLQRSPLVSTGMLPRKGSLKATTEQLPSKQPLASSLRIHKSCTRSLGDLKVTRVLVQRLLQRSKRNLEPASEHAGNCGQRPKRRVGGDGSLPFDQVGTLQRKGRELADMMERRKVDILCVQETKWKGSKARSIGAGFKLFYYGVDSKRNGVGVVLKEEFVRNVLEVKRVSDRMMSLKLEIEGVMLNVVSGYAPQVGCELEEKERFWSELDEVMESIPTGERVVIGADFNGHVGEGNTGDEEVMGKFGVKERNLEGQMVVDFAKRMDMAVVNTYFQKREEHRVTYKSGGRRTQVDYILCRRGNLKEISDCKVVVGESVARQHRMVVCRMTLMVCKKKRSEIEKKTKWWKLKKEECCEEFRQKLRQALGGQVVLPDDWETTAEVIRETGRKVLGVSSGRRKEDKETWWWNEEVQDSIQRKGLAKKKWDMDRTEENRQEYKELQCRVKREVSKAKQNAYDELYTRLDTREGEKDLYRLARQRDRDGKDVQQVRVIKGRDGRVLTSEESVQRRWKEYFEELMNEENEREKRVEGVNSVEQKVDKIRKDEVRKALKRMKSGKAVGPDNIPVEVWKCLGEAAVEFLTSLFNRVLENLEKAYDRVPREELWYCMRKSGVAEKHVRVVQDMYERSRTVVRCAVGQTEEFNVEVGLHQGSALSPFLFAIVMDQLSEEVRQESPWTMMFADDIVICSESREQVEENLEVLRASWGASRGQQYQHRSQHHRRGHHHSHSEGYPVIRHSDPDPARTEGIHLRSCGDLSFMSAVSLHRLHPHTHTSSGALRLDSTL